MQTRHSSATLLFVCLTAGTLPAHAFAQARAAAKPHAATQPSEAPSAQLPVTRVALYKNGVGFFEHAGHVTGDGRVTIDFTTTQLNDVLQSLTAVDLNGGRIAGAGYNSTTPVEQQLKALPLGLGLEPTATEFYQALRGARVEVRNGAGTFTGRLLDVEEVNVVEKSASFAEPKRFITVVADTGATRTIELTPATSVTVLDGDLRGDITRYLQLLASTRNQALRHLTLEDNGRGIRELHVSYISEVPVWKSTYRILFTDPKSGAASAKQTATLQGWSVVDNTTGADWTNVQLSLIAGAPQSFIQPLSVPYYSRRAEIPLPQEAQLAPQTHESGDAMRNTPELDAKLSPQAAATHAPRAAGVAGLSPLARGVAGGVMGGVGVAGGSGSGMGAGSGSNFGGAILNQNYIASLPPRATANAFDDYFEYRITEPVTIRKNESAMVPILQEKVDAERVTLWSPQQPQTPLRALWITNTSKLTLDRGSFSIVEDGDFGGEGLMDPIHPGEKRLLSYAVDQAVRVNTDYSHTTNRVTEVTAAKGVLEMKESQVVEVEYLVHNAAAEPRTVIMEQPVRPGYTLDSDPKPEESTPTAYRFRVLTQAGETVRLHVGEKRLSIQRYVLTSSTDQQLTLILNQAGDNPRLKQALEPILDARRRVADAQQQLDHINEKLTGLRSDEERERANMTALATTDKASRERFVHELNGTEDSIAAAQKELASAQDSLQKAKDELAARIESLQMDQTL